MTFTVDAALICTSVEEAHNLDNRFTQMEKTLKYVNSFSYLDNKVNIIVSLDDKIVNRIVKDTYSFGIKVTLSLRQ